MTFDAREPHYRIALDADEGTIIVNVQDFDYPDYKFANDKVYATVEEAAADNWATYEIRMSAEDDVSVSLELTPDEVRAIQKVIHAFEHENARLGDLYGYMPSIEMKRLP